MNKPIGGTTGLAVAVDMLIMINHWTSRVPWLTNLDLPKVDPISCQVEEEEYDEEAEEEELDDDGEWESDDYEYED